jgi:Domain of unknown function (DUF4333)
MRRFVIPACAGLAFLGVAACSPDEGDFKEDAEGFIDEDEGDVESQLGVALSDASCDEPESSDVGATFNCTAAGDDGTTYQFTVEITGDNSYEVGGGTPAEGTTPGGGTTPEGGTAPAGSATTAPATTAG